MLETMTASFSLTERFLSGKVIAVTSADTGYGRLISHALGRSGAHVILVGTQPESLAAAASNVELLGAAAIPIKADVSVALDWYAAQEKIIEIYGALHGVVHLADRRSHNQFSLLTESEWLELFYANLKSSINIAQTLTKYLPEAWLTIVGPHGDETGFQTYPQLGALRGLVEGSKHEGIRTNMVLPMRASSADETLDAPLSQLVLSLAHEANSSLRGNVIEVPLPPAPLVRLPEVEILYW